MNDSLKVTFVRHPFVRLVSAFQDKVIDVEYREWRNKSLKFPSETKVCRLNHLQKCINIDSYNMQVVNNLPNFDQFVDFILHREHEHDPHIEYFWRKCDMCRIHYDVIGKVETTVADTNYIFHKVRFTELRQLQKKSFLG